MRAARHAALAPLPRRAAGEERHDAKGAAPPARRYPFFMPRAAKNPDGPGKPKAPRGAKPASKASAPTTPLGKPARPLIALFTGDDDFLLHSLTLRLRESLEAEFGADGVEVIRFDGESAQPVDVLDECRSFDLMSRHKLVIVDHADRFVAGESRAVVERYAESPSDNATLVLRSSAWRPGKLDKRIAEIGAIEKAEPLTPAKAAGWAAARAAKRHGVELSRDAAVALVQQVGTDLARIDQEIGKLSCAVENPAGPITAEHVREWVGRAADEDLWAVQGPIASGDAEAALGVIDDAQRLWRQAPTGILYAELDLIRKAAAVARLVEQGENPFVASRKAKLWGPSADAIAQAARRAGAAELQELLTDALATDVKTKTGWRDADSAVRTIAVRWCSLGR